MKRPITHKKRCHPEFQEEIKKRKRVEINNPVFKIKNKRPLESVDSLECHPKSKRFNTNHNISENCKTKEFEQNAFTESDLYRMDTCVQTLHDSTNIINEIHKNDSYPVNSYNNIQSTECYEIYENTHEDKAKDMLRNSNELAIVPFEENNDKVFMIQNNLKHNFIVKATDLKMILNQLPRKNILYKNLSYLISNNKPLIIDQENFDILMNQLKNEDLFHKIIIHPNDINNYNIIEDQIEPEIDVKRLMNKG